jgi:hypothetical protein
VLLVVQFKAFANMWLWQPLYAGLAVAQSEDGDFRYCVALHDGTYTINCEAKSLEPTGDAGEGNSSNESSRVGSGVSTPTSAGHVSEAIAKAFIEFLSNYREENLSKPRGATLTTQLASLSPHLAVRLWTELDIIPFMFPADAKDKDEPSIPLDQEAEHMARNTVKQFNVKGELPVHMGHRRQVLVDLDGRVHIAERESYDSTVRIDTTGAATLHYANSLKKRRTKIAFFNSTAQGGGVALMRHALMRYLALLGIDCKWYVPYGKTNIFRITKDNHNILQGVATAGERLTEEKITELDNWVVEEADKCRWVEHGGPLSSRERGGADVIIVDDPQMPSLVKIAKERDFRYVLFDCFKRIQILPPC